MHQELERALERDEKKAAQWRYVNVKSRRWAYGHSLLNSFYFPVSLKVFMMKWGKGASGICVEV